MAYLAKVALFDGFTPLSVTAEEYYERLLELFRQ